MEELQSRLESSLAGMKHDLGTLTERVSTGIAELQASRDEAKRELERGLAGFEAMRVAIASLPKSSDASMESRDVVQEHLPHVAVNAGLADGVNAGKMSVPVKAPSVVEMPSPISTADGALESMKAENRRIAESIRNLGSGPRAAAAHVQVPAGHSPHADGESRTKSFRLGSVISKLGKSSGESNRSEMLPLQFQLAASPILDFSGVVELDSALAAHPSVEVVALEQYSGQRIVFQVELRRPLGVLDPVSLIEGAVGTEVEIEQSETDFISLPLRGERITQSSTA